MAIAIKAENVSKAYQLGLIGTGTISRDIERWVAKVRGKEDPFLKIGQENDRTKKGESDIVWSLKDINFEIESGDAVGIIGRNGAGKSTLLKLLSRVTSPTTGSIKVKGRIASLLEVGTGFHPELTGKENIYLNGAILGMRKKEIDRKLDQIIDFSGVERYIDTPVKRYSSGMYVRLAFAVAAHLDSEILIVDEVLAVGDAEFQQKCLGKMGDVSRGEGRTVLFVSHNMGAIKNLCTNSILLENGCIKYKGETKNVIDKYLANQSESERHISWSDSDRPIFEEFEIESINILDRYGNVDSMLSSTSELKIVINYKIKETIKDLRVGLTLNSIDDIEIFSSSDYNCLPLDKKREPGHYQSICSIPENFLNIGKYILKFHFDIPKGKNYIINIPLAFTITEMMNNYYGPTISGKPGGLIHPKLNWEIRQINRVI